MTLCFATDGLEPKNIVKQQLGTIKSMTSDLSSLRFVTKAIPNMGARPRELSHTMVPHPLSYQELPYDPEYTLYNNRLTPESLNHVTEDEMYWKVRTEVVFRHTGELPIEISGPDAESLLNRLFTRDVSKVRSGTLLVSICLLP